jgi:hypothetical protein
MAAAGAAVVVGAAAGWVAVAVLMVVVVAVALVAAAVALRGGGLPEAVALVAAMVLAAPAAKLAASLGLAVAVVAVAPRWEKPRMCRTARPEAVCAARANREAFKVARRAAAARAALKNTAGALRNGEVKRRRMRAERVQSKYAYSGTNRMIVIR